MTVSEKYHTLREQGASPEQVYRIARADGLSAIDLMGMLRLVFDLSLIEAKEVYVKCEMGAASLTEYQGRFVETLKDLLEDDEL